LVNIGRVANISISDVVGLVFIFLSSGVTNNTYYIQRMQDPMLNGVNAFLDQSSPVLVKMLISGHFIGESAVVETLT